MHPGESVAGLADGASAGEGDGEHEDEYVGQHDGGHDDGDGEEPAPEGELLAGRYRLLPDEPVAGGRGGGVLQALDTHLRRRVVLKRSDPVEARAYTLVTHPHIVTVHDLATVATGPYAGTWLVMEHAARGSLARRTMPPAEAAAIGAQLAGALAALHRAGLVHCDVKPANIVITADGTPKLADFDAAHRMRGVETITPEQNIAYTPDYAAPELVRGTPDPASDVFSLAATLHALVTGKPPRPWADDPDDPDAPDDADAPESSGSSGSSGDEDTDGSASSGAARTRGLRIGRGIIRLAPDDELGPLRPVLSAMLDADPAQRPDATAAFASLRAVAAPRPPLVRRLAVAVAVAAAVAVLAAAVVTWWPEDEPPPPPSPGDGGSILGSPRAADPCALLNLRELSRFDQATDLDRAYGGFNRCDAIVGVGGETPVDVMLMFDNDPFGEHDEPVRSVAGIGVVELEDDTDDCERGLTLPGPDRDTVIVIEAGYEDIDTATGPMPLCEIADAAAEGALAALAEARAAGTTINQRSFPDNSMAHLDACTLLDGEALAAAIPAVDVPEPEIGYANWYCQWGSTTGDMAATVRFDQGNELDAGDGRTTRVDGREAFVEAGYDGDDSCTVRVEHRAFTGRGGADKTELLQVVVSGGEVPTERQCALATDLANAAAAHLPAP